MIEIQIKPGPAKQAASAAGVTFAYYALPDLVRSKPLRFIGKSALLAVSSAQVLKTDSADLSAAASELKTYLTDADSVRTATGVAAAAASAALAAITLGEKAIYRRAERKRAAGSPRAHTKQALVLGALTGVLLYAIESSDND